MDRPDFTFTLRWYVDEADQDKPLAETARAKRMVAALAGDDVTPWPDVDRWFTVSGGRLPFPVDLRLGRDRQGRLLVTGLTVDGERADPDADEVPFGVTSTALRDLSVALGEVLRYLAEYRLRGDFDVGSDPVAMVVGPILNARAEPYSGIALTPGRKGHAPDFYSEVGKGYRAALKEDPDRPFSLLARRLFKSESQTRRLVKKARELFPGSFEEGTP